MKWFLNLPKRSDRIPLTIALLHSFAESSASALSAALMDELTTVFAGSVGGMGYAAGAKLHSSLSGNTMESFVACAILFSPCVLRKV
jgi:hypothetical protein